MLIANSWLGYAIFWGALMMVGMMANIMLKLMCRQQRSRVVVPWLLGAMLGVSVLYLAIAGGWPAII